MLTLINENLLSVVLTEWFAERKSTLLQCMREPAQQRFVWVLAAVQVAQYICHANGLVVIQHQPGPTHNSINLTGLFMTLSERHALTLRRGNYNTPPVAEASTA
jgi:hypothetical protein